MGQETDHRDARQDCADTISIELCALEHHIEQSLAKAATMVATVATRRQELGLSVFHGQQLLTDTMQLATLLTNARETVGVVHKTAAVTQRQIGVRTVAGNLGVKPEQGDDFLPAMEVDAEPTHLRRVV